MHLPIHTIATAPPASRDILADLQEHFGQLPNLAATAASSPTLLRGLDAMRRAVADASISPVLREVAGLTTGVEVGNRYGVAFHSTILTHLGVDDAEIAAIRAGRPPSDPAAAAVHAFVVDAVEHHGRVADERIDALLAAGVEQEAVLELLLEIAFATLVGLVDNLAGQVELDDFIVATSAA